MDALVGLPTEHMRRPRLPLIGPERAAIERIVRHALDTRPAEYRALAGALTAPFPTPPTPIPHPTLPQRPAMTQKTGLMISVTLATLTLLSATALGQEQRVAIGHTRPLSGPNAFAGKDNESGVRLAIEELNVKKIMVGGKVLKFDLVSEDDQCDARTGVSVAQKLIHSAIQYIMGPYCSGVAIPASRVYSEGGAMLSTVATNPKVTENGYKNLFRITAGDTQIGSNMAGYAGKELKGSGVAVIDDRTAYGQGVAEQFAKDAKKQGLTLVGQEFTTDKSTDFLSILTSLKARQPQAIFFGGYAPQAAPMARQMKQLGLPAKLLGGDTLCSVEVGKLGGDAVNDTVICAQGGFDGKKGGRRPGLHGQVQSALQPRPRCLCGLVLRPDDVHRRDHAKDPIGTAGQGRRANVPIELPGRGNHLFLRRQGQPETGADHGADLQERPARAAGQLLTYCSPASHATHTGARLPHRRRTHAAGARRLS